MVLSKEKLRRMKKSVQIPRASETNRMGTMPLGEHGPTQVGNRPGKLQWVSQDMLPVVKLLNEILYELKELNKKIK
jgi:hypothetical protein